MLDLPEEERRVITLRFGLEDGRVMNVQEVAELSRCSKDWVKRIEGRALRKLRLPKHQQRSVV
jgi:DNA-directed RNA polymerase sigma subunit (sigma70/sigma32)